MYFKLGSLTVCLIILTGCASPRLYPVCFFDQIAPDGAAAKKYVGRLTESLRKFDSEALPTEDGRWVIAKTTSTQHNELSNIWPRLACVGGIVSGVDVARDADCVAFVSQQLASGKYLDFDIKKDNEIKSDEAPGLPYVICWRPSPT